MACCDSFVFIEMFCLFTPCVCVCYREDEEESMDILDEVVNLQVREKWNDM